MATDHQKAFDELYDRLSKLNGADFDRAYMKEMPRRLAAPEVARCARPQDAGFFFSR